MSEKLLSIREVSNWLGVSERTIFRMMKNGDLKGIKVGFRWRFEERTVRDYIERRKGQQSTEDSLTRQPVGA